MDFIYGSISGAAVAFVLCCYAGICLGNRLRLLAKLEFEAETFETRRETIESGRVEVARRCDYVVTESDLFGTAPGVMTKDHLQNYSIGKAKSVDLQPDWSTLDDGDRVEDLDTDK